MEPTNSYLNGDKNKALSIVTKLKKDLPDHGHLFQAGPTMGKACIGALCTNKKYVPHFVKDKIMKTSLHCAQNSRDAGVNVYQDKKRVIMILLHHKDEK
jgi:hypothetical protein